MLQGAGDFSAGVSSALTFGISDKLIGLTGLGRYGSKCSGAYFAGEVGGTVLGLVGGSVATLGKGAAVEGAEGSTTLYRAVSQAELFDIQASGGFRAAEGAMSNKWFAESAKDAARWGRQFFKLDKQPFFTVRVQVPNSVAEQMFRTPMLDAIGAARSAEGAVIGSINSHGWIDVLAANAL